MSKDIWHTELNDFEKEQGFCCLFFTKSEPEMLCLGYYNPITQMFGNYMSHEIYVPKEIERFVNIKNLLALETELDRTHKALDVAKERLKNTVLDAEVLASPEYLASRARETLAEITALEQKE